MAEKIKDPKVKDLSPKALETVETKRLAGRMRFGECREVLSELARFDEATDLLQKKATKRMILFIVLTVLSGALTGFLPPVGAVLLIMFLGLSIHQGRRRSRFKKADLDNDFRLCLVPFMAALAEDADAKGKVRLDLDLSGLVKEKLHSKEKIDPGRFDKVIELIYQNPWCRLETELLDGSRMLLSIEDHLVCHERHWKTRSSSGKTKFKSKKKWKKLVTVTAAVAPEGGRLGWDEEGVEELAGREKVKLAEKKGGTVCRLKERFKFASVGDAPAETVDAEALVGMLMRLYSMLKPVGQGI